MASTSIDTTADVRRYLTAFIAQIALVGAAVFVSQQGLGALGSRVVVIGAAALNAVVVLLVMMDARRGPRLVSALVVVILVLVTVVLLWPVWDLLERTRLS